ncbi:MAG TPA: hypothetical protein VGZ48_06425 [Candidatus Acidoferrales bacterium]|jgi:hypothetical protein|nr:hypothetical protein [Candidatus Acidoferrales bacterium]
MANEERLGVLEVIGVALVFILLSVAGLAATFYTGILKNIDGLLLISICLMMALVFTAMLLAFARAQGWVGRGKSAEPTPTPATPPAPTPAAAGK